MSRYGNCAYFEVLYEAVQDCFPSISADDSHILLRETILAPQDYQVEFNGQIYPQAQIIGLLGHNLGKKCLEQSPDNLYTNILGQAADVIKHMNDGYITPENYQERKGFLQHINSLEFTMFATLAFFKINTAGAPQMHRELILNICRLREINDLILKYTRDVSETEIERSEYERAKPIYKLLKSLQNLGYEYTLSKKERMGLEIDHEDDKDLSENYSYQNWLKRLMLLQLRKESEQVAKNNDVNNYQDETDNQITHIREEIQKRKFDIDRFLMLEEDNNATSSDSLTN